MFTGIRYDPAFFADMFCGWVTLCTQYTNGVFASTGGGHMAHLPASATLVGGGQGFLERGDSIFLPFIDEVLFIKYFFHDGLRVESH